MRPRWQHSAPPRSRARAWHAISAASLLIVAHAVAQTGASATATPVAAGGGPAGTFELHSTGLHPNQEMPDAQLYDKGGCGGGNRSPELSWRNAPPATRAFAVTVFDPDAPGRGWWHWAVAGIPPNINHLPLNASASGYIKSIGAIEARNDYGDEGYGGPCPPPGKPHRYVVTVWALRTQDLRIANGRPAAMFEHEISVAALAAARIIVTYGR